MAYQDRQRYLFTNIENENIMSWRKEQPPKTWLEIAGLLGRGRSGDGCRAHYVKFLEKIDGDQELEAKYAKLYEM